MLRTALLLMTILGPGDLDPHAEETARRIEGELIAPCCWRAPVSDHYSPEADQIRHTVRELLAKGMTQDQVLSYYTAQYGERILSSPPTRGFNLFSWILPFAALAMGGLAVIIFLRTHKMPASNTAEVDSSTNPPPARSAEDDRYAQMLAKELEERL